jgi:hypothetical protein
LTYKVVQSKKTILLLGGNIQFIGETTGHGVPSIYTFSFENANWFKNAITKIELCDEKNNQKIRR